VVEDLVALIHRARTNKITPRISVFDCKMIGIFPTSREPMRGFDDKIRTLEGRNDVLSISVIHGFMAGDVPDMGTKVIVVTNNAEKKKGALAQSLGEELFSFRGNTRPEFLQPADAVRNALVEKTGPIVIADVWDKAGTSIENRSVGLDYFLVSDD